MQPKSLALTIVSVLFLFMGTGLIGVGIGTPRWQQSSRPNMAAQTQGLFEVCLEGTGCSDKAAISDTLKAVTGLSIAAGAVSLVSLILALVLLITAGCCLRRNKCLQVFPWFVLMFSFVAGGLIIAALIVFERKEFVSDPYTHLGLSFVLVATGGGFVVIGGFLFCIGGQYLLNYLQRLEGKEYQ